MNDIFGLAGNFVTWDSKLSSTQRPFWLQIDPKNYKLWHGFKISAILADLCHVSSQIPLHCTKTDSIILQLTALYSPSIYCTVTAKNIYCTVTALRLTALLLLWSASDWSVALKYTACPALSCNLGSCEVKSYQLSQLKGNGLVMETWNIVFLFFLLIKVLL